MPDALLSAHADAWEQATRHPFLDAVRDGTLPAPAFDTWLGQDALFVADLLVFQARLLARAPRPAQGVLAGGVVALVEELDWFEVQLGGRAATSPPEPLPATRSYGDLLGRLDQAPYPVAITALWVVERVYLLAWQHAAPGAATFQAYVEHWTAPGFADYVDRLGRLADAAGAPGDAVAEVLDLETTFWAAALQGGASA